MSMREYILTSNIEIIALEKFRQSCPKNCGEKIKKIVVTDVELLGKLAALRFIEWCQLNTEGVVSLATGRTPKTFIKWAKFFIENWNSQPVRHELDLWQINKNLKPDLSGYVLLQMDEYFPMNYVDSKSFYSYINENYIKSFGFKSEKCLLINLSQYLLEKGIDIDSVFPDGNVDVSLKFRTPNNAMEQAQINALLLIDQFASSLELKIRELGGIGFFLGGIGPDGHIAFNFKCSDHGSVTRLLSMNYESAAAASASFGGIEFIRNKAALTIGLGTITQNATTTAIILADGVGKSDVVKNALESDSSILFPATALHSLPGASFYMTISAASKLKSQQYSEFKSVMSQINDWGQQVVIDLTLEQKKEISQLTPKDIEQSLFGDLFIKNDVDLDKFITSTIDSLKYKIKIGSQSYSGKTFLHTSPHADDVMLGYFPLVRELAKDTTTSHYFATMTSGVNTVQNPYFQNLLDKLDCFLNSGKLIPLKCGPDSDIHDYFAGEKQGNVMLQEQALSSRLLRCFMEHLNIDSTDDNLRNLIRCKIAEIKTMIFEGQSNGLIVDLKRCVREWEEALVWGHLGFGEANVFSMNLGFYSAADKNIVFDRDVQPVIDLLEKVSPDIVTVALDPKDGGHPTHYKVFEIIALALKSYKSDKDIEVWGYNNVWFKFSPTQSNLFFSVSADDFFMAKNIFNSCYKSQVAAAVPSPEYDGPFCDLMQKIMQDQLSVLKQCLGEKFFLENGDKKIVEANGIGFIKVISMKEV